MAVTSEYRDFLADLLAPLGHVEVKRMFSGAGLFYRGLMFALVMEDAVYFKVDDDNLPGFEAAGMTAFGYDRKAGRRHLKSYYRVPDEVIENEDDALEWARAAVDVALRADARKPAGRRRN